MTTSANGWRYLVAIILYGLAGPCFAQTRSKEAQSCTPSFQGDFRTSKKDEEGEITLESSFGFIDSHCDLWSVPKNMRSDGASIPWQAYYLSFGTLSPFDPTTLRAAVIHDWYCDRRTQPWQKVHRVFYDALIASGVSVTKAKLMYAAVYARGPRWTNQAIANNALLNSSILPDIDHFNQLIVARYKHRVAVHIRNMTTLDIGSLVDVKAIIEQREVSLNEIDSLVEQSRWFDFPMEAKQEYAWVVSQQAKGLKVEVSEKLNPH